jgi:NAD(P)-dependent dehydrogenase (short-subunit alcohol dehydrogenase family)
MSKAAENETGEDGAALVLRPALPALRRLELRQAHAHGRSARAGGGGHRLAREDRLPGGDHAAARGLPRHRTTRFPRDAARALRARGDFEEWGDRLQIHGLDLRHTPSVEAFCEHLLQTLMRLDFIINNACQTVRRPPGFYAHLMDCERRHRAGPDPTSSGGSWASPSAGA